MGARPLPFASTVVLSTDDPFCALPRGQEIAQAWGSEVVTLPAAGHLNGDSGLGDWPAGQALLQALVQRAGRAPRGATASPGLPTAALPGPGVE